MARDIQTSDPRVDALAVQFDLALAPAAAFVCGAVDDLGYEHLEFGKRYNVTEDIASNEGGALAKGDTVYFLGTTSRAGTDLSLYFDLNGTHLTLRFNADAPQEAEKRRYFRNIDATLRPVLVDMSKRRKQLTAARAVLLHLRKEHEAST